MTYKLTSVTDGDNPGLGFEGYVMHGTNLRRTTDDGVSICILEGGRDSLSIAIEVEQDTTSDALRLAIPLALQWRDQLLDYQGPSRWGDTEYLEYLHRIQGGENTYAIVAELINQRIVKLLNSQLEWIKEFEAVKDTIKTDGAYRDWEFKLKREKNMHGAHFRHAMGNLVALRYTEEEAEQILKPGLEQMRKGEKPFPPNYPISRDHLREVLRRWRDGEIHKRLVEKEEQYLKDIEGGEN